MTPSLKNFVVIPCYNEGKRLPLNDFKDYLTTESNVHIVFVNDGSKDDTLEVIQEICQQYPDKSSLLNLEKNSGKAEAVRQGVLRTLEKEEEFGYIGFMDADLSTPLSEIARMEEAIEKFSKPSMIFGSRIKLFGSTNIIRSNRRHYIGRIIATLISKSLKLAVYDTQCGFKFIRYDRISDLFAESFKSKWLFDVELMFRLLVITGYGGINGELYELPVSQWTEKGDSKIPLSYALKLPFELIKIRAKYSSKLKKN